jgi:hypothetical protein
MVVAMPDLKLARNCRGANSSQSASSNRQTPQILEEGLDLRPRCDTEGSKLVREGEPALSVGTHRGLREMA